MTVRILLIDDNPYDRELARHALRNLTTRYGPVKLQCAEDWPEGMRHLGGGTQDLLLLDYNLPGANGLEILHELRERPHPPVVMLTGQDDIETAMETIRAGAYDYVSKSADWAPSLCLAIERVLERVHLERELAESRARLEMHAAELERKVAGRTAILESQAREIEALYLKAEEVPRIKAEIVANISHEFRTPLNAAFGYTELLAEQDGTAADAREMLDKLRTQLQRLHALLESLLALSRLRSGTESVVLSRFSLVSLAEELRAEAMVLKGEHGPDLNWQLPPEPCEVESDREKLRAIAFHLLSNAVKFTPAGRVDVTLTPTPTGGIVLRVSDTGIGLPPEAHATAFEDFRQLDGSSTRRFEGVGLGLGIVKRYAALLRGSVRLTSVPGAGTTVLVELPDPTRIDSTTAAATPGKATKRPRESAEPSQDAAQGTRVRAARSDRPHH